MAPSKTILLTHPQITRIEAHYIKTVTDIFSQMEEDQTLHFDTKIYIR